MAQTRVGKRVLGGEENLARAIMNALNPRVEERTADVDQFLNAIRSVESVFVD